MDSLPSTNQNPQNSLFTVSQAAEFLNVSAKTLRRWESKGVLVPLRTTGGQRRYQKSTLEQFKTKKQLTQVFAREHPINSDSQKPTAPKPAKLIFNPHTVYTFAFIVLLFALPLLVFFSPLGLILSQRISQLASNKDLKQAPETALQEQDKELAPAPASPASELDSKDWQVEGVVKAKGFCIEDICLNKEQLKKILESLEK